MFVRKQTSLSIAWIYEVLGKVMPVPWFFSLSLASRFSLSGAFSFWPLLCSNNPECWNCLTQDRTHSHGPKRDLGLSQRSAGGQFSQVMAGGDNVDPAPTCRLTPWFYWAWPHHCVPTRCFLDLILTHRLNSRLDFGPTSSLYYWSGLVRLGCHFCVRYASWLLHMNPCYFHPSSQREQLAWWPRHIFFASVNWDVQCLCWKAAGPPAPALVLKAAPQGSILHGGTLGQPLCQCH